MVPYHPLSRPIPNSPLRAFCPLHIYTPPNKREHDTHNHPLVYNYKHTAHSATIIGEWYVEHQKQQFRAENIASVPPQLPGSLRKDTRFSGDTDTWMFPWPPPSLAYYSFPGQVGTYRFCPALCCLTPNKIERLYYGVVFSFQPWWRLPSSPSLP